MSTSEPNPLLAELPEATRATLQRYHFDRLPFAALRAKVRANPTDLEALHRLAEPVEPPAEEAVAAAPERGTDAWAALEAEGRALLAQGKLAVVILAGGMATRFGSRVKALAPCLLGTELRFIDARTRDLARYDGAIDATIMSSFATDAALREALADARPALHFAPQFVAPRLTPTGELFLGDDGLPSLYATGHGDLPDALAQSGALERYAAKGVETVLMMNVDNLGATIEPALLALHRRSGHAITCELVRKRAGDKGGLPVRRADGSLVLAEAFRLPSDFPHDRFSMFNTNTLWIDVAALRPGYAWTWCVARKKVDGREAVQLERLVGELTWWHSTGYLRVPRDGAESRFLPVKDAEDLARAQDELRAVLRARLGYEG